MRWTQQDMPLTPQYRFEQDAESCTVFVSLSSAAAATRSTRIYSSDAFVTVTCPPYFLQLDLFDDVDSTLTRTTLSPGLASVKLFKRVPRVWDQLTAAGSADAIKDRRESARRAKELQDAKALDDLKEKKRQDEDYVFHKHWDLEKDEKRTIERQAALHKRAAEQDLDKWIAETEGKETGVSSAAVESSEPLVTYFDRQLVPDAFNPSNDSTSADPDVVPLPSAYHAKTARESVLGHASKKDPVPAFDIRKGHAQEKAEAERESTRAERDVQLRPDQDAAKRESEPDAETAQSNGTNSSGQADSDEQSKPGDESANKPVPEAVVSEQPRRTGASVNRWEAEKIAWAQHAAAKKLVEKGFQDLADMFLKKARDAAPWLHEQLVLHETEIPAFPTKLGDEPL